MFTGFWFPGIFLAVAAGFLSASGELPLVPAFAASLVGSVLGDLASYGLGFWAGPKLLRRKQTFASRLESLLRRNGVLVLLTYHYSPYLRPIMPCVSGSIRYPFA